MQDVASDCLLNPEQDENPESQKALVTDLIQMLGKLS
jgi:hypothetical protein